MTALPNRFTVVSKRKLRMNGIDGTKESSPKFGGDWTRQKLDILERYLDAYTTALKNMKFKLMYIDAFAGTGNIGRRQQEDENAKMFIKGSVSRAIKIDDKPFDRLIFVEKDHDRCRQLKSLRKSNPGRDIQIQNADANSFLVNKLQEDWKKWRGVLFLDPFATEVEWKTIRRVAGIDALDTWILFPTSAVSRMLSISRKPDDILPKMSESLTRIFGNQSWRDLYSVSPQQSLFDGEEGYQRYGGSSGIIKIYKENLRNLFGKRFMEESKTLKNSKNSPLFEFIFCVGHSNSKAISVAKRIAKYLLDAVD